MSDPDLRTAEEMLHDRVVEERTEAGRCHNCGTMQPEHDDEHPFLYPDEPGAWDTWMHYPMIRRS